MELSIVIPFFKRVQEFADALQANSRFFSRSKEIVLVLDEPESENGVLNLCREHTNIHWRVVINRKDHPWRNPAKPINVGVKQASSEVVFITSPETRWLTDVPSLLLQGVLKSDKQYHIGTIVFANPEEVTTKEAFDAHTGKMKCGSLCVRKKHLEEINGYDESLVGWGADDDNVRKRLWKHGVFAVHNQEALLVHPKMVGNHRKYSESTSKNLNKILNPDSAKANPSGVWGEDFNEVIYCSY